MPTPPPGPAAASPLDARAGRLLVRATNVLLVANGLFVLYLVWARLNYLQIDHAGHIASGVTMARGGYHELNDQAFLGYIHGLFYPPLEDVLIALLDVISGGHHAIAYKLYLSGVVVAYLWAVARLAACFASRLARGFVVVALLFLLNIEKPGLLEYQGLSFVDLWLTGLTSEVLGGVFLLLLVREWLDRSRTRHLCLLLLACVISHLVVGFVAVALVAVAWTQTRQRALAIAVVTSLGLSAFFWVPFVSNRSFMTSSNILVMNPIVFVVASVAGGVLGLGHARARAVFLLALALLLPMVIGPLLDEYGIPYPRFHYYRFGILALFLLVIGYALLVDAIASATTATTTRRVLVHGALLALVIAGVVRFRLQRYDLDWPSLRPTQFQVVNPSALELPDYGRFWVTGNSRTSDFGLDTYLASTYPSFRSTKGLFWESYRHNVLQSSWLATLLAPPVVLDYYYHYGFSCLVNQCLLDHYFHDYNVKGWIIDETVPLGHISDERRACYREIVRRGGTPSYDLVRRGLLADGANGYTVFWLSPRGAPLTNDAVERVPPAQLTPFDRTTKDYFAEGIRAAMASCERGAPEQTFIDRDALARLQAHSPEALASPPPGPRPRMSLTKTSNTSFELNVDAAQPVLFRIKLAYLPGVELVGEDGARIPLYEGMAGMLAVGRGRMMLHYQRPPGVALGYLASALTALVAAAVMIRARRVGAGVSPRPR